MFTADRLLCAQFGWSLDDGDSLVWGQKGEHFACKVFTPKAVRHIKYRHLHLTILQLYK